MIRATVIDLVVHSEYLWTADPDAGSSGGDSA
jgi:hypothetical protein